jgi:TfuA protein
VQEIIIFLGPSLPVSEAEEILKADYRPPVRREDLPEIIREKPRIVGIIDGVFFEESAVGHREILQILKNGIKVIGSSSMGALRASELEPFGMIGIGEVYRMYHEGIIEADDEVALMCDPVTNSAYSEALVNIRITCRYGISSDAITSNESDLILSTGKRLWYPDRTWNRILLDSITDPTRRSCISEWISHNKIDQKREDAKEALTYIRSLQDKFN